MVLFCVSFLFTTIVYPAPLYGLCDSKMIYEGDFEGRTSVTGPCRERSSSCEEDGGSNDKQSKRLIHPSFAPVDGDDGNNGDCCK